MCIKGLALEMDATVNEMTDSVQKMRLIMKYVFNDLFTFPISDADKVLQWDELSMLLDIVNDYIFETDQRLGKLRGQVDAELEAVTASKKGA